MNEKQLSELEIITETQGLKEQIVQLDESQSTLLKIAQESFIIGRKSHLNSLNPDLREELGLELNFQTQSDPKLSFEYKEKKNKYLSLGKSYASISFLFDLVAEEFSYLDLLLLQEILMDEGELRKVKVFIKHPDDSKIEFEPEDIERKVQDVFNWYYQIKRDTYVSPIVIAILFHFKLVSIHPFTDGNGRISRLILNLILLKNGFFPIAIPNDKRREYYECLMKADGNELEPLVLYFAHLIKEKFEQFLTIAEELNEIDESKEYLVLTEDGNTDMITYLLSIHSFNLEKVQIESYDGKDNLASAIFYANKLLAKSPNLKRILIHQDRDNENPQKLKQIVNKHLRSYDLISKSVVLITKYYDIESYFLNEKHINQIYEDISVEKGRELIERATNETSETSKSKLRIALAEYGKFNQITDPQKKAEEINALYDENPVKYRCGKSVLFKLEELIRDELGLEDKANLAKHSDYIRINEFETLKNGSA